MDDDGFVGVQGLVDGEAVALLPSAGVGGYGPAHPYCLPIFIQSHGYGLPATVFMSAPPPEQELAAFMERLPACFNDDVHVDFGDIWRSEDFEHDFPASSPPDKKGSSLQFWFGSFATDGESDFTPDQIKAVLGPLFKSYAAQAERGSLRAFKHVQFAGQTRKSWKEIDLVNAIHRSDLGVKRPVWVRAKDRSDLTAPRGCIAYCQKVDTAVPGTQVAVELESIVGYGKEKKKSKKDARWEQLDGWWKEGLPEHEIKRLFAQYDPDAHKGWKSIWATLCERHREPYKEPDLEDRAWQLEVVNLVKTRPDARLRRILWMHGVLAQSGKSTLHLVMEKHGVSVYYTNGHKDKGGHIAAGYSGQQVVFIDSERQTNYEWLIAVKEWLIGLGMGKNVVQFGKDAGTYACAVPWICIASNQEPPPGDSVFSADRIDAYNVDKYAPPASAPKPYQRLNI